MLRIAFTPSRVETVAATEIFRSESLQVVDADRDGDIDAIVPFTQSMATIDDLFLCNRASSRENAAATGGVQQLLLSR